MVTEVNRYRMFYLAPLRGNAGAFAFRVPLEFSVLSDEVITATTPSTDPLRGFEAGLRFARWLLCGSEWSNREALGGTFKGAF